MNRHYFLMASQLLVVLLIFTTTACGPLGGGDEADAATDLVAQIPGPDDGTTQAETTYVAMTEDGDFAVALVIDDDAAVAYVCDGRERGHWFRGAVDDGEVTLEHESGTRINARIEDDQAVGVVTLPDGVELEFSAIPAVDGASGLFRSTDLKDGVVYGWIAVADGAGTLSVRGLGVDSKTRAIDSAIAVDELDPRVDPEPPAEADDDGVVETGAQLIPINIFTCAQLQTNYQIHMNTADAVKSKKLKNAYIEQATEYSFTAWEQGCTWAQ